MHLCCYLDVLTSCLHLLEKGLIDGQLFQTIGLLSKALVPIAMCVATIGALLRGGGSFGPPTVGSQVSSWLPLLFTTPDNFGGGRIFYARHLWGSLSTESWVSNVVRG